MAPAWWRRRCLSLSTALEQVLEGGRRVEGWRCRRLLLLWRLVRRLLILELVSGLLRLCCGHTRPCRRGRCRLLSLLLLLVLLEQLLDLHVVQQSGCCGHVRG